jgi:hypothetical protein
MTHGLMINKQLPNIYLLLFIRDHHLLYVAP